ncbi:MAG: hypothetical protein ACRDJ9_12675 [Dehalococcoidia bacterium]
MARGNQRTHVYTVRRSIGGPPVLVTVIDRNAEILTMRAPGLTVNEDGSVTVDAATARALGITLHDAITEERSLRHDGTHLMLQITRGSTPPDWRGAGR